MIFMTDGTCHTDLDQYGCIATFHVADIYAAQIMILIDAVLFGAFCYKWYRVMQIFKMSENDHKIPIEVIQSFMVQFTLTLIAMCSCLFDGMMHLILHNEGRNYHMTMMFFLFDCTVVATCNFSMISESQAIIRKFICFCCRQAKARNAKRISDKRRSQKTPSFAHLSKGRAHPSLKLTPHTTSASSKNTDAEGTTSVHKHHCKQGQADPLPVQSRTNSINTDYAISEIARSHETTVGVVLEDDPLPDIAPKLETKITDFEEDDVPDAIDTEMVMVELEIAGTDSSSPVKTEQLDVVREEIDECVIVYQRQKLQNVAVRSPETEMDRETDEAP